MDTLSFKNPETLYPEYNKQGVVPQLPPPSPGSATSTPPVISSGTAIKDVQSNQQKLKEIEAQALKIKEGLATLPTVKTQQQLDAESGKNNVYGYTYKGERIENPNTGDNAFSADQLTAAGITDPIQEGLRFDASRGVYYVPEGGSSSKIDTYNEIQGSVTQANNSLSQEQNWAMNQLRSAITGADSFLADQISNIMADYNNRKAELEQVNASQLSSLATTGYRYGTARYVPEVNKMLLGVEERAGIQKLANLAAQTQSLVLQAKQAAQSGKFEMLSRYMDAVEKKREEQATAAATLAEAKAKAEEERKKRLKQVSTDATINDLLLQGVTDPKQILDFMNYDENGNLVGDVTAEEVKKAIDNLTTSDPNAKNIYDIQKAAFEAGAPKSVLAMIAKARNATEAFQAASGYTGRMTGDLGDLQAINNERSTRGVAPIGIEDYFQILQNRKVEIAAAMKNADRVLSAAEAQALGVPFGTTAFEAYGKSVEKPATDAQVNASLFANRMEQSNETIDRLEGSISKMNSVSFAIQVSAEDTSIGNTFVSSDIQEVRQAERNFVNAILRRESGAVIGPTEFTTAVKQYFPRPGDGEAVLKAKKQNRETAIAGLIRASGPAYGASTIVPSVDKMETDIKQSVIDFGNKNPDQRMNIKSLLTEADPDLGRPLTYSEVKQLLNIP